MVFSGGKGFHIWLTEEDTISLTDYHISEVDDYPADTLRQLSNIHRDWVKAISQEALGRELPYLDESPNFRQGIVRCPYSIHHKSGQVVWPLDEKELNILRKYSMEDSLTVNDIAKLIHEWEIPNESPLVTDDNSTWIHPEAEVFERGLPEWVPEQS
jgi:DNA primase catalytic subunit